MKTSDLLSKVEKLDLGVLHSAFVHLRVYGASEKSLDNMKPAERKELEKLFHAQVVKKSK